MKRCIAWLAALAAAVLLSTGLSTGTAQAQTSADFTHGVAVTGSQAVIWFKSNVNAAWVDIHYQRNGGAQQNLRMAYNGGTARFEQVVAGVANNEALSYWFTAAKGAVAYDYNRDAPFVFIVGTGGGTDPGTGSWNGRTTFAVANGTRGVWRDDQVFWAIIGRDPGTGAFVHVDAAGNLVPMQLSDNGRLTKGGRAYTDYFFSIAQLRSVNIPPINSARLLMSVGSKMFIQVNVDANGNIGYAGANIQNPSDPNLDVVFDFGEFAVLPIGHPQQGVFINTTRVDQFGFPLKLRVQGLNSYDRTVGEPLTETRDQLFDRFTAEMPSEFDSLAQPHLPGVPARTRIIAPAHHTFSAAGANARYLDDYITGVWNQFRNQDLVFTLSGMGTFRGRVNASNVFVFTGGNFNGTYYIHGKPSTQDVLLGAGLLADARGQVDSGGHPAIGIQLQIQAQACAALNRGVFATPANWYNPGAFYPAGTRTNWYARFWHAHSLPGPQGGYGLAYGFSYDDVGDFSPSLHTPAPTVVTYTVGW
jgi:hypothetical protein